MQPDQIMQIFKDTAYVRTGGTDAELRAAEYLQQKIEQFGLKADLEPFRVDMTEMQVQILRIDGEDVPCEGYRNCGNAEIKAPLYYLRSRDRWSLSNCKGKIVLVDGYMGYWLYQDLLENGAIGFISYDGDVNYPDSDIDQRELRSYIHNGNRIPCVNINAKTAVEIIRRGAKTAEILVKQHEYGGESRNVVLDMPGIRKEFIVFSAHYDSTPLSFGSYDNMSGSVGLLKIAEYFASHPHKYGLRFIWCGSEERGLLGSKAYCTAHTEDLKNAVLNINLDMIGCIMGRFIYCATAEEKLCSYLDYFSAEMGMEIRGSQGVYSSDSTPFADQGIPAVSFARIAPKSTGVIHCRYDTIALISGEQMVRDIHYLIAFTNRMANAEICPVAREIPENMKQKLDEYLCRKRPQI